MMYDGYATRCSTVDRYESSPTFTRLAVHRAINRRRPERCVCMRLQLKEQVLSSEKSMQMQVHSLLLSISNEFWCLVNGCAAHSYIFVVVCGSCRLALF